MRWIQWSEKYGFDLEKITHVNIKNIEGDDESKIELFFAGNSNMPAVTLKTTYKLEDFRAFIKFCLRHEVYISDMYNLGLNRIIQRFRMKMEKSKCKDT